MVIDTIHKNNMFNIYKGYSKAFDESCIVHATKRQSFQNLLKKGYFSSIISDEEVESKRVGRMESEFNLDNCIWLSIGFLYNAQLQDDYGFIFSPKIVDKNFEVFNYFIMSLIHKEIIRFWRDEDKKYLDLVMNSNKKGAIKEIISSFLETDKLGNANDVGNFPWWEIRDKLFRFYDNYPRKEALKKHIWNIREQDKIKPPISSQKKYIDKMYKECMITRGEIVTHKDICLDRQLLMGFFIKKDCIDKSIKRSIKDFIESSKKINKKTFIIFDGEKRITYKDFIAHQNSKK